MLVSLHRPILLVFLASMTCVHALSNSTLRAFGVAFAKRKIARKNLVRAKKRPQEEERIASVEGIRFTKTKYSAAFGC